MRYLVNRGFDKGTAVRFVSDHHCLPKAQRSVLIRVVLGRIQAQARMAKILELSALQGRILLVDGYNVLITVESLLAGHDVYLCDDGILRDTRCLHGNYKRSNYTAIALSDILDLLGCANPSFVDVLLDQQISKSGEMAGMLQRMLTERHLPGTARTLPNVDHCLKKSPGVVASGDGVIIDSVPEVIDLAILIAKRQNIGVLAL